MTLTDLEKLIDAYGAKMSLHGNRVGRNAGAQARMAEAEANVLRKQISEELQRCWRLLTPRTGLTRSQQNIAEMLRVRGRKVTVIDETTDPPKVADERGRAAHMRTLNRESNEDPNYDTHEERNMDKEP